MKRVLSTFLFGILAVTGALAREVDLAPLSVGYEWTYQVRKFGPYYNCHEGLETARIEAKGMVGDKEAYRMSLCGGQGYIRKEGSQVFGYFEAEQSWYLSLDVPLDQKQWWEFRAYSHWEDIGNFSTPYGNLTGCFRKVRQVGYTDVYVYCDKVGMVYNLMRDLNGNGWEMKLLKKNF